MNDDMSDSLEHADQSGDELVGRLAEAVALLRETPVEPSLVERCRQAALSCEVNRVSPGRASLLERLGLYTTAAALLLCLSVTQVWMRRPDADRERTAVHTTRTGERLAVYSDLRCEPVGDVAASTNGRES